MSGLDELIIGAFFNERPQSALPWMTSEDEGRHTTATNVVAGKDLTPGEAAGPWNDLQSDSCFVKDADDRTFGKTRASNKGIISKEFSEEVMTKVALGELSVSNITSGYGHKAKAQQAKIPNEDKTIIDVGFEELLSNNTKAVGGKANDSVSGIYDTIKPSYLDKAKSHFMEDKGCHGTNGRLNIFSNEGVSNKIVDAGLDEYIPRMTKSFLGDSLLVNKMSVVGLDTWRPNSSGTSCLSLQGGTSSIDTEIQNSFTDISSGYKPKVFPWDEKKVENASTKFDCDALFLSDIRYNDRQKLSDKSTSVGQKLFPFVPTADEVNVFEATLDRNTMIPAGIKLDSRDKSYEELLGKGKQATKDKQLYQNNQRDDQRGVTEICDFASPDEETAYIPSFLPHKTSSLKKDYSTVETQSTVPKRLVAGAQHNSAGNSNTYTNVSAGSKCLKKSNNSDKTVHKKLHVTEASYSVHEFTKTNGISPMFNNNDYRARGSKSEPSKQAVTPNPVTAWIVKAIDSEDTISEQAGDNIKDDSYDVKRRITSTPNDGQVNTVQKTRTPNNVESQPRSSQVLTKTSGVIIKEPEEIRRKRRKTKNERDRAVDLVVNQNGTAPSDHTSVKESDTLLDHLKFIKTQRPDVSQQKSVNASNITLTNKGGFKKEYHSKMIEKFNPNDETEEIFTDIRKSLRKLNDATRFINDSSKKIDLVDLECLETKVDLFMGRGGDIKVQSDKGLCKRCRKELTPPLDSARLMTSALTSDIVDEYELKERIRLQKERPVPSDVYYQLINIVENLTLTYGAEALTPNKSIEQLLNAIYNRTGLRGRGVIDLKNENECDFSLYNGTVKGNGTENVDGINVISRMVPNVVSEYCDDDTEIPYPCDKSKLSNLKPEHDTQEETVAVSKPVKSKKRRIINFFKKLICCKNVNETAD